MSSESSTSSSTIPPLHPPPEDVTNDNNAVRHIEPPEPPPLLSWLPPPPPPTSAPYWEHETDIRNERFMERVTLYKAGLNGDWETVKRIWSANPSCLSTKITKGGETVLHIAAAAKQTFLAKTLIQHMDSFSLLTPNKIGNTALCFAAVSGVVEIAEAMVVKNDSLPHIRGSGGMTPLHMAVLLGHLPMVTYLLTVTNDALLNQNDRMCLITSAIDTNLFGVASGILHKHPHLAIERDAKEETPLHALAKKPLKPCRNPNKLQWRRVSDDEEESREPEMALDLVQMIWNKVIKCKDKDVSQLIGYPWALLFVAAKLGKVEFLTVLIRSYPDIIWKVNDSRYSIFHIAVIHRHERIFKLIYEIGAIKDLITSYQDDDGNNMLHLASKLAPPNRLNSVSGAALQMQREIFWFEAVERIMRPEYTEAENNKQETPRALFSEQHEDLRVKGEEWMKKTAESCTLVAALIATVVFAAAFQLPGGVNSQGSPNLVGRASFMVFAISNATSLFTATASILMFLSILTSRYAERDFLRLLPSKLMMGLILLLVSMAAMIVAFTATFFITFQDHGPKWAAILVATFAFVPVTLFASQQIRLLVDIYQFTYESRWIFQSYKPVLYQQGYSLSSDGPVYETIVTFPQQLCQYSTEPVVDDHVSTDGITTSSSPTSTLPDLGPSHSDQQPSSCIPTASLIVDPVPSVPRPPVIQGLNLQSHMPTTSLFGNPFASGPPAAIAQELHPRPHIPTTSLIVNPVPSVPRPPVTQGIHLQAAISTASQFVSHFASGPPDAIAQGLHLRPPIPTTSQFVSHFASGPPDAIAQGLHLRPPIPTASQFVSHFASGPPAAIAQGLHLRPPIPTTSLIVNPMASVPRPPVTQGIHLQADIPTSSQFVSPFASGPPSAIAQGLQLRPPIPKTSLIVNPMASVPRPPVTQGIHLQPPIPTTSQFVSHFASVPPAPVTQGSHLQPPIPTTSLFGNPFASGPPAAITQGLNLRPPIPTTSQFGNPFASEPPVAIKQELHLRPPIPTASLFVNPMISGPPAPVREGLYLRRPIPTASRFENPPTLVPPGGN